MAVDPWLSLRKKEPPHAVIICRQYHDGQSITYVAQHSDFGYYPSQAEFEIPLRG